MAVMGVRPMGLGFVAGPMADPDIGAKLGADYSLGQQQNNFRRGQPDQQFWHQEALADQQNQAEMARLGAQLGFNREQLAQQGALTRQQIEASLAPTRFAQSKFNTLFPWVQQQMGGMLGGGKGQFGYNGPGLPAPPPISDAPVYSEQQINQNVNAQRAENDAATVSKQRGVQGQMASRGYGANSPLSMALQNSLSMGNLATNTANERDLRWQAAQGNATQRLEAQKARATQDLGYRGEETKRGIAGTQQQTALMSALLGML